MKVCITLNTISLQSSSINKSLLVHYLYHAFFLYFSSMAMSNFLSISLFVAFLFLNHGIEASHVIYPEFQSLSAATVQQTHRTGFHFQPPKHWINGTYKEKPNFFPFSFCFCFYDFTFLFCPSFHVQWLSLSFAGLSFIAFSIELV